MPRAVLLDAGAEAELIFSGGHVGSCSGLLTFCNAYFEVDRAGSGGGVLGGVVGQFLVFYFVSDFSLFSFLIYTVISKL